MHNDVANRIMNAEYSSRSIAEGGSDFACYTKEEKNSAESFLFDDDGERILISYHWD